MSDQHLSEIGSIGGPVFAPCGLPWGLGGCGKCSDCQKTIHALYFCDPAKAPDTLAAENERLRKALRPFQCNCDPDQRQCSYAKEGPKADCPHWIARAALKKD